MYKPFNYVPVSVELLPFRPFVDDAVKHVELCGRTCYNSTDKIAEDSAEPFVKARVSEGHYSIVEHANFVFQVDEKTFDYMLSLLVLTDTSFEECVSDGVRALNYTKVELEDGSVRCLVSGNARAFSNVRFVPALDNIPRALWCVDEDTLYPFYDDVWGDADCEAVENLTSLSELHLCEFVAHTYLTFRMCTDIGAYKDLTRHRRLSWTIESTRWCDYSKERNGGGAFNYISLEDLYTQEEGIIVGSIYRKIQDHYQELTELGASTDKKRAILPHGLAAKCICTGNIQEYLHVFNLRYKQNTGHVNHVVLRTTTYMYKYYESYVRQALPSNVGFDVSEIL